MSPPPPLIDSPSPLSYDAATSIFPASSEQLLSSASPTSPRESLLDDSLELNRPAADTAAEVLLDCRSDVDGWDALQQQSDESISQIDVHPGRVPCEVPASAVHSSVSLQQSWNPPPLQDVSYSAAPYVSSADRCITDARSLTAQGSLTVSDANDGGVVSFSTNVSESGLLPADGAFRDYPVVETGGAVLDRSLADPPRTSVMTLAQQLDTYWAQRGYGAPLPHDPAAPGARSVSRPTAPPPAPPADDQLTTQTLPRAASTRSLQAPPPRPPPRLDSNNTSSALLGRSLPPEPLTATLDRSSRGQMTTFQGQRSLGGGQGGLSGSVQSLPGCDVTSAAASLTTSVGRAAAAPQPPRRGSSMSPRLQAKSTRYGGRARSTSLRSTDPDVDPDVLSRFVTNSSEASSRPSSGVGVRDGRRFQHKVGYIAPLKE